MTTPTGEHARRPRLVLERVKGQGPATYELGPDASPITIGRKEGENQLVLRDEQSTVSRRHASIEPEAGGYRIRDLASRNGVRVQGHVVSGAGTLLADGDEIHLGLAVLRARLVPIEEQTNEDRTMRDVAPPPPPAPRRVPPVERPAEPRAPTPAAERPVPPSAPPPQRATPVPPPQRRPPGPPPVPVPPPSRPDDLPVLERRGPFAIHRVLHTSDRLALEAATDTRHGRLVLVRRWRGLELGFFARRRFRKAFDAVMAFRHESVLSPLETGSADGDTWIVYPDFDGVTAGMIVRAGARDLRIDLAVHVARETCRAVEALARGGIAGPGVTDQDVLVGRDGTVRLLAVVDPDGLVRDERYTAPEEDSGGVRDARSAVFSIGILLYELLVREPIVGTQKLTRPSVDARRSQVGSDLAAAVMRALEIEPHARFADAGELGRSLGQALEQVAPDFRAEQVGSWVASRFAQ